MTIDVIQQFVDICIFFCLIVLTFTFKSLDKEHNNLKIANLEMDIHRLEDDLRKMTEIVGKNTDMTIYRDII